MAVAVSLPTEQPRLVFFHSTLSGNCRRVEGFLAQVLQRRRNHGTFDVVRVAEEERPDLLERFKIETLPTLVVVQTRRSRDDSSDPGAAGRSKASSPPGSTDLTPNGHGPVSDTGPCPSTPDPRDCPWDLAFLDQSRARHVTGPRRPCPRDCP